MENHDTNIASLLKIMKTIKLSNTIVIKEI